MRKPLDSQTPSSWIHSSLFVTQLGHMVVGLLGHTPEKRFQSQIASLPRKIFDIWDRKIVCGTFVLRRFAQICCDAEDTIQNQPTI